ncbi:MAG: hypothetical protein N3A54_06760, partial [Patescibacteria group bacterium]|nr:hypothetical protein [Patescibacteria group bacterium]
ARITLDAYPDTTISGVIRSVGFIPRAGEIGTVYPVEITFQESNPSYRLGMTGDATFITQEKQNTLIVPISFVTTKNGKKYVTIKNNGKFEDIEVTTGLENDTEIEILSGVSEGTVVYD